MSRSIAGTTQHQSSPTKRHRSTEHANLPPARRITERPYGSEAVLQQLLAKHPSLLAGNQLEAGTPRRWLLVVREASLPSEADGGGR